MKLLLVSAMIFIILLLNKCYLGTAALASALVSYYYFVKKNRG